MSKRQVEELNSLVRQRRKKEGLGSAKERRPIPAGSATSTLRERQPAGSGGGIASPLTEIARTVTAHSDGDHDYYVAVQSTVEDANGVEHTITWLQPDSPDITVV